MRTFLFLLASILFLTSCGVRESALPNQKEEELSEQKPTLINGVPADPKEWPASVYASMGNSRCSATVVGERVLLIAAHCVSNGGVASFSVGANRYSSRCEHSPNYRGNSTSDWALCQINNSVTGIEYEVVNQDENRFKVGDELTLTGYGCVRPGGGGGNDGIYRVGQARIIRMPSGTNNDIVTRGGGALCFGDSGGPAFFVSEKDRYVVSVNSRGDISTTSYLSALHTTQFKTFATAWVTKTKLEICGITDNATGCRKEGPKAFSFTLDTVVADIKGLVKPDYLDVKDKVVEGIKTLLEGFKK